MQLDKLTEAIAATIAAGGVTLATAESCSGGLIAHRITDVPGSSQYFRGGIVAYSNEAKESLLGVPHDLLAVHGAVSEPVARAMAEGARRVFGADYAVGVTGIAGPTGGSTEKPVGLVYIAVAGPSGTISATNRFNGSREAIKEQTAEKTLTLLLEQLR
jgi:PncC family amidohydrolase